MGLSPRQKQIAAFVEAWIARHGRAPTRAEIASHLGFSSLGTVQRHIDRLVAEGVIARDRYRHRGLSPQAAAVVADAPRDQVVCVPLLGTIQAGQPVESFPVSELLDIPRWLVGQGEHFALRVRGDSMSGEGILDGDLVVVRRRTVPQPGDVVVALVRGEATVKRFFPGGEGIVELRPSAPGYLPLRVRAEDVQIQGVVVALVRKVRGT